MCLTSYTRDGVRRDVKRIVAESTLFEDQPDNVPDRVPLSKKPIGIVDRFFYRLLNTRLRDEFGVIVFDDTELDSLELSEHARSMITVEVIVDRILQVHSGQDHQLL
jgi:hypothetical protein